MADTDVAMSGTGDFELPARKKPKISELPLSGAQRASIDGMLHTFKKKGEFDSLRKKVFQQYNESAQRGMFEASLRTFTTAEIDRDSIKYLKPDRRIAAPLLEGAAARADVYEKTGLDIDAYIEQYVAHAEQALREIRRKEIGDEAAAEEIRRGKKSEESYAADAEQRRAERAKKHVDDEKKRKRQEATERKKKELEALKKKQAELQNETERLQREQKRRAEREAWKAAEKERERERIRKFNEEREKQQKEVEEREKALQEERDRRAKERADREQKRLEAEALDLLLKEGQEMAEKSRRPELERSESMEPPPRLRHQAAPRNSHGKDQMRAQGLMPTSLTLKKGDRPSTDLPASTPTGPADRRPRALSPSPARSYTSRRRNESPDDRRGLPRDRRDNVLRDISAEREAWKARQRGSDRDRSGRDRDRDRGMDRGRDDRERERPLGASRGEDGEVVERAQRQAPPPRADSRGDLSGIGRGRDRLRDDTGSEITAPLHVAALVMSVTEIVSGKEIVAAEVPLALIGTSLVEVLQKMAVRRWVAQRGKRNEIAMLGRGKGIESASAIETG
ncbi:unnamed protein product [Zymoseptoria tritici ST99CH_3D7]|uniref:BOD1/SHG1 domain-containing protein n=1 Tax=Zymoseptoria tritici (strain ST99CH_3D7) TaxID=1276538 RepID=A0A1X7RJL5_ZYMT9|nr:unnamed protein product [Zymoseptoria tritici ST99CH_3D7]